MVPSQKEISPGEIGSYAPPDGSSPSGGDAISLSTQEQQAVGSIVEKAANWAWRKHVLGYFLLALGVQAWNKHEVPATAVAVAQADSMRNARLDRVEAKLDSIAAGVGRLTIVTEDRTTLMSRGICASQNDDQQRRSGLPCEDLLAGHEWKITPSTNLPRAIFTRNDRY
jgi:hypothetical protein